MILHTNNEYRFGQIINDRKKLTLSPKFGGTRIEEEDIPTCLGLMKECKPHSTDFELKTWQVMATYNKTNHIITLHVIEQNRSRKIDTKHIPTTANSIVTELHPLKVQKKSQTFASFLMVEQLSGWLTLMGLYISSKDQTGCLVTIRQRNTYLMNDPRRWSRDILTVSVVDEFVIATRIPLVKVYSLKLSDSSDQTLSAKLNGLAEIQYVDHAMKALPTSAGQASTASSGPSKNP